MLNTVNLNSKLKIGRIWKQIWKVEPDCDIPATQIWRCPLTVPEIRKTGRQ